MRVKMQRVKWETVMMAWISELKQAEILSIQKSKTKPVINKEQILRTTTKPQYHQI